MPGEHHRLGFDRRHPARRGGASLLSMRASPWLLPTGLRRAVLLLACATAHLRLYRFSVRRCYGPARRKRVTLLGGGQHAKY
jgi:hypothetical protein